MAAQFSLPSILWLHPLRDTLASLPGLRAGARGQLLGDDLLEKIGSGGTEGEWTYVDALPGQGGVAPGIKSWTRLARRLDPRGELLRRHRAHVEMHVGETVATIM